MNIYRVEIKICATAYIKAMTPDGALEIANALQGLSPLIDGEGDVPITGMRLSDPHLPDVSLSPAMTIHEPWSTTVERADD